MFTIKNNIENELEIKKSKFITKLYKVTTIEEINNILNEIKIQYKDATHICYAYILENLKKYSDDKEPKTTAGFPMYNILEKNELTNILAITIRYFGGTKLGAGPLSRTYAKSVNDALKLTEKIPYRKLIKIKLITKYENKKLLETITSNLNIINKVFNNDIIYEILLNQNELEILTKNVDKTKINIII